MFVGVNGSGKTTSIGKITKRNMQYYFLIILLISLFVPTHIRLSFFLFNIAAPNILFPLFIAILVLGIISFKIIEMKIL